jgi:hypothetical protein
VAGLSDTADDAAPECRGRIVRASVMAWLMQQVVLMWQDGRGIPSYWDRTDIANFLANLDPARIPWRKYTLTSS